MKAILSLVVVVGIGTLACAADKVDPVGTWNCEYEISGQKLTASLTIKKDGNKLAGTMSWPDQKDEKLKNVKLNESTLTYSAVRKFMGKEYPLDFTLNIEGDKFQGTSSMEFGGSKQEFEFEGKRQKLK